ncbi:MAG TPA: endopeptidase La [Gemmatimonadaceae bacterium]|nr:endopeptidase La [Gemmatimonadaceae bacterium]
MPIEFTRDNETFTTNERMPVLPLRDLVLFPYVVIPLLVGRQASLAAVEAAVNADKHLFLVAQKSGEIQEPGADDLYRVGVIARVLQVARVPNGTTKVLVEGIARARVKRYGRPGKLLQATVQPFPVVPGGVGSDGQAARRRALTLFEEYVALHRRIPGEVVAMVQAADSEQRQAYGIAAHVSLKHEVRQQLLELPSLPEVFERLGDILSSETELLNLERKIDDDVRGAMVQNQREFYLQEQLRAIHRELGEDESDDFSDLEAQLREKALPDAVHARATRELRKLRRMSPMSPEYTVARNFADWIVSLPWNERTDDVLDVAHARQTLDADHYGLDEVKDRIIDFIAVLSLVGRIEGPILCLVGPPGVGKTSLGKSIARALGRKFVRMSLGGIRDEAEIRGHRRTYIGSMPGRIIQAMRRAEVVNPVILLDEIDKLGADFRGDPAAALLEVLDPEQNRAFNDHYLEVDYDLSQVLFVTTANSLQGIPDPLRDRMEIIRLAGYLDHEKLAIARQYLVPRQLQTNGLDPAEVTWEPDVLPEIMRNYTREAGVRELERRIARVARKLARRIAESPGSIPDRAVRKSDIKALLGTPPHDPDDVSLEDKIGVAAGLAYTTSGGELLEVEVSAVPGRGKLQLTGTLGDVMKESASAALSYTRSRVDALSIRPDFYKTRDIHVHLPAGATPKDGPSAGIAIATAVISALTQIPVRGDVAMTGEITLRGRVLPIGGLKEKAVAAHRNKVREVIIPHGNLRDLDELPEEVTRTVRFHPVKTMDEVLAIALRGAAGVATAAAALDQPATFVKPPAGYEQPTAH